MCQKTELRISEEIILQIYKIKVNEYSNVTEERGGQFRVKVPFKLQCESKKCQGRAENITT